MNYAELLALYTTAETARRKWSALYNTSPPHDLNEAARFRLQTDQAMDDLTAANVAVDKARAQFAADGAV